MKIFCHLNNFFAFFEAPAAAGVAVPTKFKEKILIRA